MLSWHLSNDCDISFSRHFPRSGQHFSLNSFITQSLVTLCSTHSGNPVYSQRPTSEHIGTRSCKSANISLLKHGQECVSVGLTLARETRRQMNINVAPITLRRSVSHCLLSRSLYQIKKWWYVSDVFTTCFRCSRVAKTSQSSSGCVRCIPPKKKKNNNVMLTSVRLGFSSDPSRPFFPAGFYSCVSPPSAQTPMRQEAYENKSTNANADHAAEFNLNNSCTAHAGVGRTFLNLIVCKIFFTTICYYWALLQY